MTIDDLIAIALAFLISGAAALLFTVALGAAGCIEIKGQPRTVIIVKDRAEAEKALQNAR